MSRANWAGIILTIVLFFFLVVFISSKIEIYDGTTIQSVSSASLWDLLIQPINNFFDGISLF